jgi:FkbM family methyltransferase
MGLPSGEANARKAMGLSIDDRLKHLVPGWLYYPHKIASQRKNGEPELRLLHDLVPAGCTAIDVGANRGYYSYALSKIAGRVEAFEPHPLLFRFARRKLGSTVRLHAVALSNRRGSATLHIPQSIPGIDVHYNSSLKRAYAEFSDYVEIPVRLATLDDFGFDNVRFIKVDCEGSDMDVLEGGQRTIARDRPNMVVELIAETHADPLACVEHINAAFGYVARIMVNGRLADARSVLQNPHLRLNTCNVVFTPK